MKKVFLFFAVAAVFAACAPKQAAQDTNAVDSVATTVDSAATATVDTATVDTAAATVK